jgi:hypothetical protein
MDTEMIKKIGKCCISGKPMSTSEYINLVALDYVPTWEYPISGNVLIPKYQTRAVAIVHDDEMPAKGLYVHEDQIKFAVEFRGEEIIYHPIEDLQKIQP